tara:strand:- start:444 stop:1478 length:1035 start_codon:yes stop_codon:yes gene_type:complete
MASNSKNIAELLNGDVTVTATDIANDAVTADKLANSINTDIATGVAALPKAGGTMTGALKLSDGTEFQLGDSSEFKIKHHASGYTHLENGVGTLYIDSDSVTFRDDDGSPNNVVINQTGLGIGGSADQMLTVGTTSDAASRMQMYSSPTGSNTIHFGDGTSAAAYAGYINYAHTANTLQLATNGVEGVRLTPADTYGNGTLRVKGNIGINFGSCAASQYMIAVGTDNSYRSGVAFELQSNQSLWDCGFVKITACAGRNGLESRVAAEFLYKFQMHNESISGIGLVSSSGNTGAFTISVTAQNPNSTTGTVELKIRSTASTNYGTSVTVCELGNYSGINKARREI